MEWDAVVYLTLWLLTGGGTVALAAFARKWRGERDEVGETLHFTQRTCDERANEIKRLTSIIDETRRERNLATNETEKVHRLLAERQQQHDAAAQRDRKTIETLTSQRDRAMKIIDDQVKVYNDGIAAEKTGRRNDAASYEQRIRNLVGERDTMQQTAMRLVEERDTERRGRVAVQNERDAAQARLASIVNAVQGDTTEPDDSGNTL